MNSSSKNTLLSPAEKAALGAGVSAIAAAGLGLAYYAARVEPETLTVTRPKLCRKPPVKTLFFSDLHLGPMYGPDHLAHVVDAINRQQPQLVVFGGDFFAKFLRDAHMLPFRWLVQQLSRIQAPLGKYAVLGNHEMRQGARPFYELLFSEAGFRVLWDEIVSPAPGIAICGLSPYSNGRILKEMPQKGWRLVLCHMPDKCRYLNLKNADLVLAGHSHAGQVRLPILTKMILPPGGKLYPYGLYQPQGPECAQLFVSRGIGMSGVPFRFLAPPELVVLE